MIPTRRQTLVVGVAVLLGLAGLSLLSLQESAPSRPATGEKNARAAQADMPQSDVDWNSQFALTAEVVEALEGGPVTLKMTLEYLGSDQICIERIDAPFVWITTPAAWTDYNKTRFFDSVTWGSPFEYINQGRKWSYLHYLHREYFSIPAGQVTLSLQTSINYLRDTEPFDLVPQPLAQLSLPLTLTIPQATPDRRRQLVAKLQGELQKTGLTTHEEKWHLEKSLLNTNHKELLPIGLALLASEEHGASDELLDWMYDLSQSAHSLTTALTEAILTENPAVLQNVFSYWQTLRSRASEEDASRLFDFLVADLRRFGLNFVLQPQRLGRAFSSGGIFAKWDRQRWRKCLHACLFRLPDQEWQKLTQSKDLWIQALTYATFPERCDPDWRTRLLADLPRLAKPLSPEEMKPLLQQLDHKRYSVRQRATQQLIHLGDRANRVLEATLAQQPSLEMRQRIQRILDAQTNHPPQRSLLPLLVGRYNPADIAMLQALASGDETIQLTKDARKLLKEKQAERRRP